MFSWVEFPYPLLQLCHSNFSLSSKFLLPNQNPVQIPSLPAHCFNLLEHTWNILVAQRANISEFLANISVYFTVVGYKLVSLHHKLLKDRSLNALPLNAQCAWCLVMVSAPKGFVEMAQFHLEQLSKNLLFRVISVRIIPVLCRHHTALYFNSSKIFRKYNKDVTLMSILWEAGAQDHILFFRSNAGLYPQIWQPRWNGPHPWKTETTVVPTFLIKSYSKEILPITSQDLLKSSAISLCDIS